MRLKFNPREHNMGPYIQIYRGYNPDGTVGDPYGGPAYGEKNGPVLAVVAVIASAAPAFEIGLAGLSLMQGISLASSVIGLVGTITGNKTLSLIGAVGGLAGSAVGMLNKLGTAAQASGAIEDMEMIGNIDTMTAAESANIPSLEEAGVNIGSDAAIGGESAISGLDAMPAMTEATDAGPSIIQSDIAEGSGLMDSAPSELGSVTESTGIEGVAPESISATNSDFYAGEVPGVTGDVAEGGIPSLEDAGIDTAVSNMDAGTKQGLLGKVSAFFKDNKEIVNLVGGFIKGAYQTPAQKAQARYYLAQAKLIENQMKNANQVANIDSLKINPQANVQSLSFGGTPAYTPRSGLMSYSPRSA